MPRFKLTLAYVGTRYHGWQIQVKPSPPPTIQGEVEGVFRRVVGRLVRVHGAGRTDSGVHAEGQVAHVDIPDDRAGLDWQCVLNAKLPRDIRIMNVEAAPPGFHARFDVFSKTYVYQLWASRRYIPPRLAPFAWDCGAFDLEAARAALPLLAGRHDFACLQNAGTPMEDTVRTLMDLRLDPVPHASGLLFALSVTAGGFLKQMVRNITGLLVSIGQGKFACGRIPELIAAADRRLAPPTAPPQGLTLARVDYAPPTGE